MAPRMQIKYLLIRLRLWYPLNLLRTVPQVFRWLRSGCGGVAPSPIKAMIVVSYVRRFRLNHFIETGTYMGDTLNYIAEHGTECRSIELSPTLYAGAVERFKRYQNVKLYQGDSAKLLPELLQSVQAPTLFWLDGHFSHGVTERGALETPISTELQAILNHPVKQHVILIDDARCFDGSNDYPHLDDLLRVIRENGTYSAEVSADIIRLVPEVVR